MWRRFVVLSSCAMGVLSVSGEAVAQQAPPKQSSSQFTLRREQPGGPQADAARGKARAGDCAGALAGFDNAIRVTTDPTLRRDRGLCHEKLGNPYPAIDDYRAYLTDRPDASDSDQIRERLSALEAQIGVGGPSSAAMKASSSNGAGSASASASGSASASASTAVTAPPTTAAAKSEAGSSEWVGYDDVAKEEKAVDTADASALRNGKGFILGPFVHIPRFLVGDGVNTDLGYGVGGTFRYSTGPLLTVLGEIGYAGVGTSGASNGAAGPLLLGGAELRFPISRFAGDHLLLRGGIGYERLVVSGSRAVTNNLLARFGAGFRHVFGPSLGLEFLVDGGPVHFMPEGGGGFTRGVIGGSTAFLIGF